MNALPLILRELLHRRTGALLTLLAVIAATALPIASITAGDASQRETTRLMRDLGYNLRIVPRETEMAHFWAEGYSQATLPEECVTRFRERGDLLYRHLIALLQRRVEVEGTSVLLTGIAQELSPAGIKQSAMIFVVEPGTVVAGYEPARALGLVRGAEMELFGRKLVVADVLAETGTAEDTRLWLHLADAQALLLLPGRINEIKALECNCAEPGVDPLAKLRAQLEEVIPEGRVLRLETIARARERQRRMVDEHLALVLPVVLAACAAWIALLAAMNVRERLGEIGILRALGHASATIALLFLGRAILLGLVGALAGFGVGSLIAVRFGTRIFETTGAALTADWSLLPPALLLAPLFAAAASFLPTLFALTRDPAQLLRPEA